MTYKLNDTVYRISKYNKLPGGYSEQNMMSSPRIARADRRLGAPLFLTVQLGGKRDCLRPGDTDPHVNAAIQKGLYDILPTKTLRSSKEKVIVLINALKE